MANKIDLEVNLKTNLQELDKLKSTPELKLTKQQQAAYDKNRIGAETALANNDLKAFRQYFNNMTEILKKASIASGQISKNLQELTEKQEQINKDIQKLTEKRDDLKKSITSSKGEGTLPKKKANELLNEFGDRDKIVGKSGNLLSDASVINSRIQKLAQNLQAAGKTWSQVTDKMAQAAGFQNKGAAQAGHRFYEGEQKYITDTQKQIGSIDTQISEKQAEEVSISGEIDKIKNVTPEAKKALDDLYATLTKIKTSTNTQITDAQTAQRKEEAGKQSGAGVDSTPLSGELKKQETSLGRAFKQFTIYNIALRAVKKALREAVATVKELDKELTEQAMVTGLTREQTYKLVKSYQDLAAQTGATTKEVASVATEYMKQGKSINDALTLTEAAVSAAKVAGVSTADSVNYLTTALNGFQLAAEDAMLVSDKFAAVAAASATDYDELAIALSKVASQANLAGMSIDYTTALLTKGLETTREAPETMGTALKTIIARMRELSDYGETLEGDIDINNVESQLAYVGIALRGANGELRSTEDVLDDLGKKWDTLNKNQQAAVAKALAGTRQQSRLIAMMSDYERVTELQEIAQRSAGATAAQAGVYLEGIEAALNNITIAWEKIVTAFTNSEVIIGGLNVFSNALEKMGGFLDTTFGMITATTTLVALGLSAIGQKRQEYELNQLNQKINLERAITEAKTNLELAKQHALQAQIAKNNQKALAVEQKKTKLAQLQADYATLQNDLESKDPKIQAAAKAKQVRLSQEMLKLEVEIAQETDAIVENDEYVLRNQASLNMLLDQQHKLTGGIMNLWAGATSIIVPLKALWSAILIIHKLINKEKREELINTLKQQAADSKGLRKLIATTGAKIAASVAAHPGGWLIALGILAAVGIGIAVVSANMNKNEKATEKATGRINELSNEIYKLEEKANAINKITSSFERLDNKVIKTKKDIEEMHTLLEQAADSLSSETFNSEKDAKKAGATYYGKGISEQDYYKTLTDKDKLRHLEVAEAEARHKADVYRQEQLNKFNSLSDKQKAMMLDDNTADANILKSQSALYAINNDNLYEYIDLLQQSAKFAENELNAVEELTTGLLAELSAREALNYANNPQQVQDLVDDIIDLGVAIKDADGELNQVSAAKILTSDDYGITEKAKAFQSLADEFGRASEEYQLLEQAYSEYAVFAQMGEDILKMIDYLEISIDDINKLNDAYTTLAEHGLKMTQEEYKNAITADNGILATLESTGGDIQSTIEIVFGSYLSAAEDYNKTYKQLVLTFNDLLGQGALNMGQNITKLENKISSFYEKASHWNDLSEAEKTEFMSDNAQIFEENPNLLHYIETNQWDKLAEVLSKSDALSKEIERDLKYIETELEIQKALGKDADQNYVKWLNDRKSELLDTTNLFKADLDLLLEQQEKQLSLYKDYLSKQQEQLEESLEKRKEAYSDYFDAINQQQEDEDYKEQSDQLVTNLSKLASSTDAAANKQRIELEQQLEDLEKERQQTLRERAQDVVLENLDKEVESISKKFDELLNNEQLMLEAMQGDIAKDEGGFLKQLLASAREGGMTDLQLEDFSKQLTSAFGNIMDVSNINEYMETIQNNATISIDNQSFALNQEDGEAVWKEILSKLIKYGYGR